MIDGRAGILLRSAALKEESHDEARERGRPEFRHRPRLAHLGKANQGKTVLALRREMRERVERWENASILPRRFVFFWANDVAPSGSQWLSFFFSYFGQA